MKLGRFLDFLYWKLSGEQSSALRKARWDNSMYELQLRTHHCFFFEGKVLLVIGHVRHHELLSQEEFMARYPDQGVVEPAFYPTGKPH